MCSAGGYDRILATHGQWPLLCVAGQARKPSAELFARFCVKSGDTGQRRMASGFGSKSPCEQAPNF